MPYSSTVSIRWLRLSASLALGIGLIVVFGWIADWPLARRFAALGMDANMNAAVALILCAFGVLARASGQRLAARVAGWLLVALAGIVLLELLTGWPAQVNRMFWVQPESFLWVAGRMAPHAAFAFLIAGLGLGLAGTHWSSPHLNSLIAGFMLGTGGMTLVHFVIIAGFHEGAMPFRNMAIPIAFGFVLLGAGQFDWRRGLEPEAGPRLLVGIAAALVTSITVFMVVGNTQLIETNRLVVRAQESRAAINNLISRVARMESTARAYALTGEAGFSQRIEVHVREIQRQLVALSLLVVAQPRQETRLDEVRRLARDKIAETERLAQLRAEEGVAAAARYLDALPPEQTSRLVRRADEMLAEEEANHRESLGMQAILEGNIRVVLGAGGFSLLVIIMATTLLSIQANQARYRAEHALTEVNRLQRAVLDGGVFSVIATEPNGIIREFNRGAERMLGYTREEMVGRCTPETIHVRGELAAQAIELGARLGRKIDPGFEVLVTRVREGAVDEREWTYVRKDGTRLPVQLSITALRDHDGKVTGFLGIAQDLTEKKRAQVALQASEKKLGQVLGHADCLVWEAQVVLQPKDWNWHMSVYPSGLYRRLAQQHEAEEGAGLWYRFKIPEQEEMNRRSRAAMERGETGYIQEFRLIRDGRTTWLREAVAILSQEAGRFWLVGVATDVTDRKLLEETLGAAEERFRRAFDHAGIGMALVAPEGRWLQVNQALQTLLGYSEPELITRTFQDITHPEDLQADLSNVQDLLAGRRRHYQIEKRYIHRDGQIVYVRLTVSLVRDSAGAPLHFIAQVEDITARNQTQRALEASQRQLVEVFRAMAEGLVLQDRWGKIIECNAAAEAILGLDRAQLLGLSSYDPRWQALNEDGSPCAVDQHPAVITRMSGQSQRGIIMGVRKADGALRWVSVNSEAILEDDGHLRAVVCSFADITDRREAELKLREALTEAQRFREAQDNIPSFVYMKDTGSRYIYANRPTLELFACTPQELVGSTDERFFSPETAAELREIDRRVLAGNISNREIATKDAEGKPRYYWEVKTPIYADQEHKVICGLLGISTDITDRKRVAEALAESEERTRLFAEHAPASVAMFDREMRYLVHSAKWLKDYGLDGRDIIGRSHYEVFPEISEDWKEIHRRCLAGAIEINEAAPFDRADGSRQWLSWRVQPWRTAAGEIGGIVMFTEDITSRKELENSLAAARDQALTASKLKSEFLANVSHEIRTPMNGVLGMADLLMDTALTEDQQQMGRVIQASARNLLTIIDDLLDFSKIEAGKFRITTEEFNLAGQVDQALALMAPRAVTAGITLASELPADLPARLSGDPGRIQQVLVNLLGNAVKFTEKGQVSVTVKPLAATGPGHYAFRAEVRDTGIGITEDQKTRLFQPFMQVDGSTTRRFGGTGLGLAISRQLIELMGGRIGCESEPGRGSIFWFELELPLATGPVEAHQSARAMAEPVAAARLLVAEDQQANQLVMRLLLNKLGLEHTIVGDGQAAIEKLVAGDYALVLMDCQMPRMDGYEATRLIRAGVAGPDRAGVPIVAITAHAMASDREKCLEAGMDDYLSKPIRLDALQAILQRLGIVFSPPVLVPAGATQAIATPVLDAAQLAVLRSLPGRTSATLLEDLSVMALQDVPANLELLRAKVAERSAGDVVQGAHRLAGSAANLGATSLRAVVQDIERSASSIDWPAVDGRLGDLDREWVLVQQALRAHLPKPAP